MAERKKGSAAKLRALEGQVHQFDVPGEMTGLLQRIRANKTKRSASVLVKTGPIRVSVLALDEGGQLEDQSVDGPFTMQCVLGRVRVSVQGRDHRISTGDLLVVDTGVAHDISAEEASVLLVTVAAAKDGGT
jgi:quercetin dioxygenase-like cupin family protein